VPANTPGFLGHVEAWIFDLDNTLYAPVHDLFGQIDRRMKAFIAEALDLPPDDAFALQKKYYWDYGTTLRGLMLNHRVDPNRFLDFVHDIDHSVLPHDAALDAALAALPGRKFIYTNGSTRHAERVMEQLGVSRHFAGIFDICAGNYIPKPEPAPYTELMTRYGIMPARAAMIEDLHRNLKPAAALGLTTVWLRHAQNHADAEGDISHCHHVTDNLITWLRDRATPR
jgi:putative hydrolase of the HAD superfamily